MESDAVEIVEEQKVKRPSRRKSPLSRILLFSILEAVIVAAVIAFVFADPRTSSNCAGLFNYDGTVYFDFPIENKDGEEYPAGTTFKLRSIHYYGMLVFESADGEEYFHKYSINDASNSAELEEALKNLKTEEANRNFRTFLLVLSVSFLVLSAVFVLINYMLGTNGLVIALILVLLISVSSWLFLSNMLTRAHAPIIYLYPQEETRVNVQLDLKGRLTETVPEYKPGRGWDVTATPEGVITGRDGTLYPYLFWEADLAIDPDLSSGFCVRGEDTKIFLKDALKKLSLSDNETGDFLEYWLPYMEDNPYNIISFQTYSFEDAAELKVEPSPDTVIRVNMLWYPSDSYVDIPPQDLTKFNPTARDGFTLVEWGGEKYDMGIIHSLFR